MTPETIKGRDGIIYEVTYAKECNVNKTWTHYFGLKRPKGSKNYIVWAKLDENGKITHQSTTVPLP